MPQTRPRQSVNLPTISAYKHTNNEPTCLVILRPFVGYSRYPTMCNSPNGTDEPPARRCSRCSQWSAVSRPFRRAFHGPNWRSYIFTDQSSFSWIRLSINCAYGMGNSQTNHYQWSLGASRNSSSVAANFTGAWASHECTKAVRKKLQSAQGRKKLCINVVLASLKLKRSLHVGETGTIS